MTLPLAADGRAVIVALDHPLYSWPCRGLEDREAVLRAVVGAGADAVIVSYGTLRDYRSALVGAEPILKLDLTTLTIGGYGTTEYAAAWTVDDALRSGAAAVLTYVQVGTPFELAALQLAGHVAAAADAAGVAYVCEIMPQGDDPLAIAACCRSAAELGARVVKTSFPQPASAIADAVGCGIPVVLAGGDPRDSARCLAEAADAMGAGAAGVAFGRNVWGAGDPAAMVRELGRIVHGAAEIAS
jgi:fructose-bisphosphate aldolase / 2-amino-3,7-dideoxy-D-threo-hept-6-ulosonate synthase